jgi:hypothetical protein
MPAATSARAIDRLIKAADRRLLKKEVQLGDGSTFSFWHYKLVMAERERAQKDAGSDDANAFALQLLVLKALDEGGQRLFSSGEIALLKNDVDDGDLQKLMLALLKEDDEPLDPKSAKGAAS